MRNIIIHFPFRIDRNRASASQLRPLMIVNTFKSMGFDVCLIEGYGKDRQAQIRKLKNAITNGVKFDFLYSECNTIPTLLTEKHHYPTYPFLDFSFFKFCKKQGIEIGLFYRDIYWCFQENNQGFIRKLMKYFHLYDLREYNKYVSILFVPSFEMVNHIPYTFKIPIVELYPGCKIVEANKVVRDHGIINILYVGGVGHHYDVNMIMKVVKNLSAYHLTICCRPDDWDAVKDEYQNLMSDNISVVHKSGKELVELYANADLFCLFVRPDQYWEFAVPFKLFETIGNGCPIIASEGTWVANFVKKNKIGFTCKYDSEALRTLLTKISNNIGDLAEISKNINVVKKANTWESRCNLIAKTLTKE